MTKLPPFVHLRGARTSVLIDLRAGLPVLAWFGAALHPREDLASLCASAARGRHESQPDVPVPPTVFPLGGRGHSGTSALLLVRGDRALAPAPACVGVDARANAADIRLADPEAGIEILLHWRLDESGLMAASTSLRNTGTTPFAVSQLASLALPLPPHLTQVTRYSGRWAAEMREQVLEMPRGTLGARSFGGRPGFGGGQWLRVEEPHATETQGRVLGAHLAWSGDHELLLERDNEGNTLLMLSARLDAGELQLAPGESFRSPEALVALSGEGRAGVRQAFHACIRQSVVPSTARTTPRKVHLNTWEAVGFRMSADALGALVRDAAALGVERFVLDDGWFLGRRDDTTSLGDWVPDPVLFPEGLQPLIREVQAAGMDFGLWVEPEMVSPQSELLRAHPDWCLHLPGHAQPTQRHQLVLDLTRPEVGEHLFGRLDTLLGENDIAYLKWDHNRELFPRAGKGHAQVLALYALLERLRAAHPDVEIESCASGGARVDAGILRHTARVWASDNNDPIERLRINRGWFQFLPGSVTGNHVGPSPNPVTGRRTEMDFRAKVAMFGHMGVEADPSRMTAEERATLAAHIALYKEWRDVLHAGQLFAVETGSPSLHGWFAWDGARGLALLAQTAMADDYDVPPLRLPALDPEGRYRLHLPEPWPHKAARYLAHAEQWREGIDLGGRVITERGLALPLAHPETAWLIAVETL